MIIAPARIPAMIESLPEPSRSSRGEPRNDARLAVARILAPQGDDRWRTVERNLLHIWRIDSEED